MGWIRDLFTVVLNMSVTGGITILAILALRILLKKAPRKYLYALWLAAAFRLLCPWAPYSGISLFNLEIFRSADMKGQTLTWYVPEGNGQTAHGGQTVGNGAALALFLGGHARIGSRSVDKGDDGAAEFFRPFHQAQGLPVALRVGHAEIAP